VAKKDSSKNDEPDWINRSNDRKTPYTDEELDEFVADFIANMADTPAWKTLVDEGGEEKARQVLRERFTAQDDRNLINWDPAGPAN